MRREEHSAGFRGTVAGIGRAALTRPYLPVGVAILAVALTLPSLSVGWLIDDHIHRSVILRVGAYSRFLDSSLDIFRFIDGDPQRTGKMMDFGVLPWWTFKQAKAAFWQPLTALTHWLDYRLWPESPAVMHAHSLLWFGALVGAVALLYRRLMGVAWVAGLAAILWAIDDAHGMPVGFLANRNAILATFFGVVALLAHDRWRRDGWRTGAAVGPLALTASLLSAEGGIATCAYLAAHAVFMDRGTRPQRCAALLPHVVVVVVWRIVWMHLGYGVSGTGGGLYIDPITDPRRFAAAVVNRAPIYLLGQWAVPPSEITLALGPERIYLLWLGALAFLAVLSVILWPLVRRDRVARFWALGMILSLLPICATWPWDRHLFFVGIGAMGLLSQFFGLVLGTAPHRPNSPAWRRAAVVVAGVFVLVHLIIAPLALPIRASYPLGSKRVYEQLFVRTPLDRSVERQDVVIVNPPVALTAGFLPLLRELDGTPAPRRVRILAPAGRSRVVAHRPDARTLVVRPDKGYLLYRWDRLFRDDRHPMVLGERVELTGMTVEVTELTDDGRPAEASFRFAVPLEDPSLRWLQWINGAFVPFTPPAIGESVALTPRT